MNFLLLSASAAICSAKVDQKDLTQVDGVAPIEDLTKDTTEKTFDDKWDTIEQTDDDESFVGEIPTQDSFVVMGPINGVCSSEFNSHPLVMKTLDTEAILGKWKTVLVDQEILDRMFVPLCMTAEFSKLDGQEELIFRVGEIHSLKDDVTNKEVFAYSGQTMSLLFDNLEVPTIANQYSYSPSSKFTQFLEVGIPDVLVTMTCLQIRAIAPPQMIEQMEKQAMYAEMRGNLEFVDQIRMEMQNLSTGQMINMYEVHVKDVATYDTPEKMEALKDQVSEKLDLMTEDDRLQVVMQDPTVCAVTRDL